MATTLHGVIEDSPMQWGRYAQIEKDPQPKQSPPRDVATSTALPLQQQRQEYRDLLHVIARAAAGNHEMLITPLGLKA